MILLTLHSEDARNLLLRFLLDRKPTVTLRLRAGCPTIICPFFGDQPFWGQRIYSLGVGPKPIPQKQLTVKKLAQAFREVTSNSSIGEKAKVLGERIRAEDGIKDAIAIIETLVSPS